MKLNLRLTLIKQQYEELNAICKPSYVSELHPKSSQRERYRDLLKSIRNHHYQIKENLNSEVFENASISVDVPRDLLDFYSNEFLLNERALDEAYNTIDPSMADLSRFIDELIAQEKENGTLQNKDNNRIHDTFNTALERLEEDFLDNPEWDEWCETEKARNVFESKLIKFNPDEWLENTKEFSPIRTSMKGDIPIHAKQRLVEIYRSYTFGNWLSVIALSRTVLEYVLFDTASNFNIEKHYLDTKNNKKIFKRLSHLIEDFGESCPDILDKMNEVRELGNEYIHPKKKNKEALFQSKTNAKKCMEYLRDIVEFLYFEKQSTNASI